MGFPMLVRWHIYIESGPRSCICMGPAHHGAETALLNMQDKWILVFKEGFYLCHHNVYDQSAMDEILEQRTTNYKYWWYQLLSFGVTTVLHWLISPGTKGCCFADNIFKWIFMNEKFCTFILISLKFVLKGPNDNKSSLVQVMAWCRTGIKPSSEPILTQFTDICSALGRDELSHRYACILRGCI